METFQAVWQVANLHRHGTAGEMQNK